MANLVEYSIYGISATEQEKMIHNSLASIQSAQIYLMKAINNEDDYQIIEANKVVVKLSKLEKKIKKLIQ